MKATNTESMVAWEVVKVVDLKEITLANDSPSFSFRVEILREWRPRGTYRARVYRKETFRVQPTFPQKAGRPQYEPSDEEFFVEDIVGNWEGLHGRTAKEVLEKVLQKINKTFRDGKKTPSPSPLRAS
jgi:hypothetical protein